MIQIVFFNNVYDVVDGAFVSTKRNAIIPRLKPGHLTLRLFSARSLGTRRAEVYCRPMRRHCALDAFCASSCRNTGMIVSARPLLR